MQKLLSAPGPHGTRASGESPSAGREPSPANFFASHLRPVQGRIVIAFSRRCSCLVAAWASCNEARDMSTGGRRVRGARTEGIADRTNPRVTYDNTPSWSASTVPSRLRGTRRGGRAGRTDNSQLSVVFVHDPHGHGVCRRVRRRRRDPDRTVHRGARSHEPQRTFDSSPTAASTGPSTSSGEAVHESSTSPRTRAALIVVGGRGHTLSATRLGPSH